MFKIKFLPHTTDIRMKIAADSIYDLYNGSLLGMTKLLVKKLPKINPDFFTVQKIKINSVNETSLLIDTLSEILSLVYIKHAVFIGIDIIRIDSNHLVANIKGYKIANNQEFVKDIKAVTYHQAKIIKSNNKYQVTILFDI